MHEVLESSPANQFRQPETFEEAVDFVYRNVHEQVLNDPLYHFGGGMSVRNTLGLWQKDSPLYKHMLERFGLCHADDTGHLISEAARCRCDGVPYDPTPDVERFKAHWRAYGLDPATMEKVGEPDPSPRTVEFKVGVNSGTQVRFDK